jgi:hypothetical protein
VRFDRSGVYRFTTGSDDGLRIRIDGRTILDQWYNRTFTRSTTDVYISAGEHLIEVEYYDSSFYATVLVDWQYHTPSMVWEGSYYRNPNLSGEPAFIRNDQNIKFDWGSGSPDSSIPDNDFSVRWRRSLYLPGGAWQFYTRSDDGSRVFVNGQKVLDQWWDHPAQSAYSNYQSLNAGTHNIVVDFYERGGVASMEFAFWPRVWAEYWDKRDFTGNYRSEVLNSVSKRWWLGGPHNSWWQDNFSSRFTWPVSLRGGTYRICVNSDDGFRFKVDGTVRFERWRDSVGQTCANIDISAGWRTFQVEHYEAGLLAYLEVTWGRADGAWYGVAQPSASSAVASEPLTQDQPVDEVTAYFQLLHERGTLGLGLEAEQQEPSPTFIVRVPLVQR